ncbi:WbqC family protein [Cloacibacterium caeni]|jgi:hypothetical protein|uniref:WbqC family protein n=1 Tax=Cloacibacterium caeni TaxID=2004710 RepID=UPI001BCD7F99|nr:WbqC family protein [Cloacibacterium caeni]
MKKIAILQSNYIPWKGYFDIMGSVDEFIIYDEMQYTKNDWRNRNKIKTTNGLIWLTIPVKIEKLNQKINETKIADNKWYIKHKNSLQTNYGKATKFKECKDFIFNIYEQASRLDYISEINYTFLNEINKFLKISTKISFSTDYNIGDGKTERLINICKQSNSNIYLSGPSAKNYIDEALFTKNNINLEWFDYIGYKEYEQLYPPFEHGVSILDLIFNTGEDAYKYLKSTRK